MQTRFRFRVLSALGALVTALLLVVPSLGAQQGGTVTGRVIDASSGQALAAVQVFISSLDLGGLTQQNGRYLLQNVPAGTHTLEVSRIGYRTTEAQITVGGGQTVEQNFSVAEEALQLDAIVVTGTPGGTQRRAIGNAVVTIDAAAITAQVPITSMQQMLAARTPGLNFTRLDGSIGVGSSINIRGFSSIAIGNQPLIYVDGIRVDNSFGLGPDNGISGYRDAGGQGGSALDDINPNDIESIEIIKGPAAATLYGTEASAGVIQIITKKGSVGAPEFTLTVRQGQNFIKNPASLLGTQFGCRAGLYAGRMTGRNIRPCHPDDLIEFNIYDYTEGNITNRNPDAVSANPFSVFSTGYSQTYNLGVAGGTETVRYFISADYLDAVGVVDYNAQMRLNLRTNIDIIFNDDLSIAFRGSYQEGETTFQQQHRYQGGVWTELFFAQGNHLVSHPLNDPNNMCVDRGPAPSFTPLGPDVPCNPAHAPQSELGDADGFYERDPRHYEDVLALRDYSRVTSSITATHNLGSWLTQRLTVGIDNSWTENTYLVPRSAGRTTFPFPYTSDGHITVSSPTQNRFSFDYSASAIYEPNSTIQFVSSAGVQYNTVNSVRFEADGDAFPGPFFTSLSNITDYDDPYHRVSQDKSLGFYVQEQIGFNGRLFLTAAVRADDSSAFGDNFERQYYPKVSGTWTVSEENFWDFDFVNSMRVRSAWGQAGRQPNAFARTPQFDVAVGPGGSPAIRLDTPGNPDVGPETSVEWEGGVDIAVLDDRVFGEFTYFKQWVTDALVPQALAPSNPFTGNISSNLGSMENWGWEAALDITIIEGDNFGFNMRFSGDHTANIITKLDDSILEDSNFKEGWYYPNVVSHTMDSAKFSDPSDFTSAVDAWCDFGDPLSIEGLSVGGPSVPCAVEAANDQQLMWAAAFPAFTWSIAPTFRFLQNQLEVYSLIEGQYGRWLANIDVDQQSSTGGTRYNARQSWLRNQATFIGARSIADDERWTGRYSADFWKVREIGARYQVPQSVVGSLGVDRASIAFSASNMITIWRRQWRDRAGVRLPDVESVSQFSGEPNFSLQNAPSYAAYSFVLRVSF